MQRRKQKVHTDMLAFPIGNDCPQGAAPHEKVARKLFTGRNARVKDITKTGIHETITTILQRSNEDAVIHFSKKRPHFIPDII